jgi:hypothetical protein
MKALLILTGFALVLSPRAFGDDKPGSPPDELEIATRASAERKASEANFESCLKEVEKALTARDGIAEAAPKDGQYRGPLKEVFQKLKASNKACAEALGKLESTRRDLSVKRERAVTGCMLAADYYRHRAKKSTSDLLRSSAEDLAKLFEREAELTKSLPALAVLAGEKEAKAYLAEELRFIEDMDAFVGFVPEVLDGKNVLKDFFEKWSTKEQRQNKDTKVLADLLNAVKAPSKK